ncbi:MAG: 2-C-methyl-D-erythritol 2,4-cyclodiphosphate synthase [Omnitrophica WOR_2 bacterium RIFCSPLOWO2_12_FULL_50_9]|nr:MAG: 2-C-methyl-D-erythritol 2,4-cyclodiphosphate synthase [Omnitrophica WOR_2 bacterium RIFCSPHIGHO2_02_FULL_50_17]OGX43312.1 MAG: 2-C-methyl-D-erythritol 2,4-cyclodiphosphate synthase [Omnitrophica WOR_2 bacterium RIFCSPLOWO2_12_FULL_50_9]
MQQRIGIGYDIHRFVEGRKLILGGVEIPFSKGLEGHSDADVLLHALCDALLGAAGKGDIGEHFPNTNPKYKDVSSLVLLQDVYDLIVKDGYAVSNVDTVLQVEEPSLKSYKPQMKANIAKALHIGEGSVNIKATTQEGLGAIGQGQGIAAFACVLLVKGSIKTEGS